MRAPEADASRSGFEAWRSDPENRAAYDEIAAVWAIAGTSARPVAQGYEVVLRRSWLRPALIAAGIAAAFTLAFVVISNRGSALLPGSVYMSSPNAMRVVVLPDGSRITLHAASRVRVAFSSGERRVTLIAGRARFAVAHEPARPFRVLVGTRAVVARGTVFDVRIERELVEVTLLEGAVDLEQADEGRALRPIARLAPGQTAIFERPDAAVRIASASANAWTAGLLSGDAMRLADVIAEANRQGRAKLSLADPALGDLRVSGGFQPGDTEALAATLAAALDLEVVRRANGDIVLARASEALTKPCGGRECAAS